MENKCKNCGTILQGRSDKIYCDNYCKSAYQYKNEKENQSNFYLKVDKQLKSNRKISPDSSDFVFHLCHSNHLDLFDSSLNSNPNFKSNSRVF